ncbi:MAG: hypothetical protein B7Z16_07300 [Algoriphagus sp. 32-45-6]|jgi:hypothetical protein|nr:MAG: hypothetical protein B7Z16_07300 [Algoriphagus sp. 32-45-6]
MDDRLTRSLKKTHLVLKSPPPWTLRGEGIILLFKFSKEWIDACSHISDALKKRFRGGLGYVMMVDYHESPVGPYRELLIIPGKFRKNRKHVISRIVVDSEASTINGRANWGIPKETFPIDWKKEKGKDFITIKSEKEIVFSAEITYGGIPFPVSTSILPISLCQKWNKVKFHTKPSGSGWGKLAKLRNLEIDPGFFPDFSAIKPLLAVRVNPFTIVFPEPYFEDEFI